MKNMLKHASIIAAFFVFAMFAIPAMGQDLPLGKWRLTGYNFDGKLAHPLEGVEITMNVNAEGKLGGKSGCNTYGGSYATEDGKLKISDIFSTKMFCGADENLFESSYYELLTKSTKFTREKGTLTLTDPKSLKFLVFAEVKKPRDTTIYTDPVR